MEKIKNDLASLKTTIENDDELSTQQETKELVETIAPFADNLEDMLQSKELLTNSLNMALQKFEISHPKLAEDIRIIINSLNEIGI